MSDLAPFGETPIRTWEVHGLRCALMRAPFYGAINGYVRVPGLAANLVQEINVHGGVTYESGDWIGFDTLHSGDMWPGDHGIRSQWDRTWTEDQVAAETEQMAAQAFRLLAASFVEPAGGAS